MNHINYSVQSLVLKIKLLLPYKNVSRFLQSLIYSILLAYNLLILFMFFVFLIMSWWMISLKYLHTFKLIYKPQGLSREFDDLNSNINW